MGVDNGHPTVGMCTSTLFSHPPALTECLLYPISTSLGLSSLPGHF